MSQYGRIGRLVREAVRVHLQPYWKLQLLVASAVVVVVLFETCFPLTIKFLVDEALIPHDRDRFVAALVILVLLFALSAAARLALALIRAYMHGELYWDMSTGLFRLLKRLPLSYFDHLQPGHFSPLFDTELLTLSETVRDLVARGFHAFLQMRKYNC